MPLRPATRSGAWYTSGGRGGLCLRTAPHRTARRHPPPSPIVGQGLGICTPQPPPPHQSPSPSDDVREGDRPLFQRGERSAPAAEGAGGRRCIPPPPTHTCARGQPHSSCALTPPQSCGLCSTRGRTTASGPTQSGASMCSTRPAPGPSRAWHSDKGARCGQALGIVGRRTPLVTTPALSMRT